MRSKSASLFSIVVSIMGILTTMQCSERNKEENYRVEDTNYMKLFKFQPRIYYNDPYFRTIRDSAATRINNVYFRTLLDSDKLRQSNKRQKRPFSLPSIMNRLNNSDISNPPSTKRIICDKKKRDNCTNLLTFVNRYLNLNRYLTKY